VLSFVFYVVKPQSAQRFVTEAAEFSKPAN